MKKTYKVRLIVRCLLIIGVLSGLYTLALLMYEPIFWYLFYFFSLVLLGSFILIVRCSLSLKPERAHGLTVNQGDKLKAHFHLKQLKSSAFFEGSLKIGKECYPLVRQKSEAQPTYAVQQRLELGRGVYQELALAFVVTDWFGVLFWPKTLPLQADLVVLPAYLESASEKLWQELSTVLELTASIGLRAHELKNLRQYQAGDSLRQIDWKLSAKNDELVIKEFEPEVEPQYKFIFVPSPGADFEKMLALFYSFKRDYGADLGTEGFYLLSEGKLLENPQELDFARLPKEQELALNLSVLAQEKYRQQHLLFFMPHRRAELIAALTPYHVHNSVTAIYYHRRQLVVTDFATLAGEEEGHET